MIRSLYTGTTGLKGYQKGLDNIGNNIANINTTAYKSASTTFGTLLSQNVTQSSAPTNTTGGVDANQVGLGMSVSATNINVTKSGAAQTTGNQLDFRIDGTSFFVLHKGTEEYYTKDGTFQVDANGDLVNADGLYVYGWVSGDGETVSTTGATDKLNILGTSADGTADTYTSATADISLSGYIRADDSMLSSANGVQFTASAIGSDGNEYTIYYALGDGGDEDDRTFSLTQVGYRDADGNYTEAAGTAISLTFDEKGTLSAVNGTSGSTSASTTLNGPGTTVTLHFDDLKSPLSYNKATTVEATQGDADGNGIGYATGSRNGFQVDTSGRFYATYSNGASRLIGQMAVADFQNPLGLEKIGDNLYGTTLNTGTTTIHDVTENNGRIISGQVEMSNVELSVEMSNMIIMQRAFQANSRVITTSDSMLSILSELKR